MLLFVRNDNTQFEGKYSKCIYSKVGAVQGGKQNHSSWNIHVRSGDLFRTCLGIQHTTNGNDSLKKKTNIILITNNNNYINLF